MKIFSDQDELIQFAKEFVEHRIDRLENVVQHCLYEIPERPHVNATFPAILYCFATIDLLTALYTGKATREKATTSKDTKKYMRRFMRYKPEQCDLLMGQFRHKMAHLAEPKPVIESKGKYITWEYVHNKSLDHPKVACLSKKFREKITSRLEIKYDHKFQLSILSFLDDIKKASNKYLLILETDTKYQEKFEKAIEGFYSINP